jgi:hypothetical protein
VLMVRELKRIGENWIWAVEADGCIQIIWDQAASD